MDHRELSDAVAELRAQTFAIIDQLHRDRTAARSDVSRMLVDLQDVANRLGTVEGMLDTAGQRRAA